MVGVLEDQPQLRDLAGRKTTFCRATLQCGKQDITIDGYGDRAKTLASTVAGSALKVVGTLEQVIWTTGDDVEHQRMVVRAFHVEQLAPPDRLAKTIQDDP